MEYIFFNELSIQVFCPYHIFGKWCFHFNLVQNSFSFKDFFFFFWVMCWFRSVFNIHVFGRFSSFCRLLISSFIPLWSKSIDCIICILLHLLRCVLWTRVQPIFVYISRELKRNVHSVVVGWSSLRWQLH